MGQRCISTPNICPKSDLGAFLSSEYHVIPAPIRFFPDFVRCIDTKKSTFGYLFLLARRVISWKSAKQFFIVSSTMEVEFVACFEVIVHGLWLQNFISRLGIVNSIAKVPKINYDNFVASFF